MTPPEHDQVGPFSLIEPLGRGAMGEVWRGRHPAAGDVAIKLMTAAALNDPYSVTAFEDEVRAMAGLHHPHIAWVVDRGVVSSPGRFPRGTQWLAMELCSGGNLRQRAAELGWDDIRELLLQLLSALAHAHAAGVVHRDLKPANVLWPGPADPRQGWKLTDFGIAHLGQHDDDFAVAGTAKYMAPEQLRPGWRHLGPWTDLYALGVMAWTLVTGRSPHHGKRGTDLWKAKVRHDPGSMRPRFSVPEGLEAWLRLLLCRSVGGRFQRAADASAALRILEGGGGPGIMLAVEAGGPTLLPGGTGPTLAAEPALTTGPIRVMERAPMAVVPPSFASKALEPIPLQLDGAGQALVAVRHRALVGRETQRSVLWTALLQSVQGRKVVTASVTGPAGIGKSALVEWLVRTASEQAGVLGFAAHQADDGGLTEAVVDALRTSGLEGRQALEVATELLREHGLETPEALDALKLLMRETPVEKRARLAAIATLIGALAQRRPGILVLDGCEPGGLGEEFCPRLLSIQVPLLVVWVGRLPPKKPMEHTIELGPLDDLTMADVVRGTLSLRPGVVGRLVTEAQGNPEAAISRLEGLVSAGLMVSTRYGYELAEGAEFAADEAHELRRAALYHGWTDAQKQAVELAVAVGKALGSELQSSLSDLPLAQLKDERLMGVYAGAWHWQQVGFVAAVAENAKKSGRWEAHHRWWAMKLVSKGIGGARLAAHLMAAGDYVAACKIWFRVLSAYTSTHGAHRSLEVVRVCLEHADTLSPKMRLKLRMWEVRTMRQTHQQAAALPLAHAVLEEAIAMDLPDVVGRAAVDVALLERMGGGDGLPTLVAALAFEDRMPAFVAGGMRANLHILRPPEERTGVDSELAAAHYKRARGERAAMMRWREEAELHQLRGKFELAEHACREGIFVAEKLGKPLALVGLQLRLGTVLILQGRVVEARLVLEAALRWTRVLGALAFEALVRLNLGIAEALDGDPKLGGVVMEGPPCASSFAYMQGPYFAVRLFLAARSGDLSHLDWIMEGLEKAPQDGSHIERMVLGLAADALDELAPRHAQAVRALL